MIRRRGLKITRHGPKVEAVQHHGAPLPEQRKPGEHCWIVTGMWRVTPRTKGEYQLDTENLITLDGPGCFHCEELWSPELAARPCAGDPNR